MFSEASSFEQEDVLVLKDFVRKQYCSHLEKVLTQNYITWYCKNLDFTNDTNPPRDWLKKCTALYEDEALKKCMVLDYYRKEMLQIISSIRNNTSIGKLAEKIKFYSEDSVNVNKVYILKPFNVEVSTQTEDISGIQENKVDTSGCSPHGYLSLDDKIELFKKKIYNKIDKKKKKPRNYFKNIDTHPYCKKEQIKNNFSEIKTDILKYSTPSPINSPNVKNITDKKDDCISHISHDIDKELNVIFGTENDEIEEELDKLFKDDDDFGKIFGCNDVTLDDPRNETILKELENAKFSMAVKKTESNESKTNPDELIEKKITILSNKQPNDEILKESLWPCELNMRKQKLSKILGKVDDIFVMERIKNKFTELFGPEVDEEDDFVIYSPSLELNSILLGSCMKRIAPWIVKHLMRPMNEGLIANRYLFKKLAKMLAKRIVEGNLYPSERYVKERITDFFCQRKRVDIIDDILIS